MPQVNFTIDFGGGGGGGEASDLPISNCPLDIPLKWMAHERGFQSLTSNINDCTKSTVPNLVSHPSKMIGTWKVLVPVFEL